MNLLSGVIYFVKHGIDIKLFNIYNLINGSLHDKCRTIFPHILSYKNEYIIF